MKPVYLLCVLLAAVLAALVSPPATKAPEPPTPETLVALVQSPVRAAFPTPTQVWGSQRAERSALRVTSATRANRSSVRVPPHLGNRVETPRFLRPRKAHHRHHRGAALDGRRWAFWMCVHAGEGRWTARNDGYEGGLQFVHSTWVAHGGQDFAEHAYDATPAEQVTVANRVSNGGSWLQPWPNTARLCAPQFGMSWP
jgi:hypothetical protein